MGILSEAERLIRSAQTATHRRFNNMIRRGVVKLINDALKQQTLQVKVMAEEPQDDVEHVQMVGFTSHPPKESEAWVLRVGGNGDAQIVVGTAHRDSRPKVSEGAAKMYHTDGTATFHAKGGGEAEILATVEVDLGGGATKGVARVGDPVSVTVTIPTGAIQTSPPLPAAPVILTAQPGTITMGSAIVKAVD